ncbi:cell wall assembly regulator SMI1 [Xanthomonas arboricola]|nr:cell wall assembly regulator SMI1 [Xanthomonas euroxanthea]
MIKQGASSTALAMHTDPLHWPLPAHRRGTLSGMDAAPEPTGTYLRRVPRWWAGKSPATKRQIDRSAADPSALSKPSHTTQKAVETGNSVVVQPRSDA